MIFNQRLRSISMVLVLQLAGAGCDPEDFVPCSTPASKRTALPSIKYAETTESPGCFVTCMNSIARLSDGRVGAVSVMKFDGPIMMGKCQAWAPRNGPYMTSMTLNFDRLCEDLFVDLCSHGSCKVVHSQFAQEAPLACETHESVAQTLDVTAYRLD